MKHLRIPPLMATAAVAMSLVLGGCGGSGSTTPPPEPEPMPMPIDVTMSLTLPAGVMAAAFDLAGAGMSDSFTVAAGMTETRGGVNFTCDSAYPCMVMLANSAGTLVAEYMTQKDMEADTAMVMAAAVPVPPIPPIPPPPPMPTDVSGEVDLIPAQQAALKIALPDNGDTAELMVGADGVKRQGVTFTCESDYPCTITVSNNAGTIVAMYASQVLGAGTASAMAMGLEPPVDTFARLNAGSTESIRDDVGAQDGTTAPTTPTPTELIGMGIGGPGVTPEQAMPGLRSDFQANGGGFVDADGEPDTTAAAAAAGASPALMGGTMITGATDAIEASADMGMAPDGWVMKTLFRDWGDTAGDGDGGYETAAIVVKNLGEGTPHPFDRDLSAMYVNTDAQAMFALTILAAGDPEPTVVSLATSVSINADTTEADSVQWANMVFDSDSLVPAQSQDLNVNPGETFTGSYFGAPGQFQCIAGGPTDETCALARNDDGTVGVNNISPTAGMTDSTGRWSFTPDPGAMITVPDQDWMAYGAWLTTPDNPAGGEDAHRLGVFFNGMDTWAPIDADAILSTADNALRGTATYSGGATGVYVDGEDSGLFTARAMLTAVFDADGIADDDDYMISGRIDNFRGTDGVYLGDDTQASPNDPTAGKDSDWVVELGSAELDTGVIAPTVTTGSADGVSWNGGWDGQLFGPSGTAAKPLAPSGVAGRFWAETADADSPEDGDGMPVTAVLGAFGATKDD